LDNEVLIEIFDSRLVEKSEEIPKNLDLMLPEFTTNKALPFDPRKDLPIENTYSVRLAGFLTLEKGEYTVCTTGNSMYYIFL
jgi:hypothetical protein